MFVFQINLSYISNNVLGLKSTYITDGIIATTTGGKSPLIPVVSYLLIFRFYSSNSPFSIYLTDEETGLQGKDSPQI